MSFGNLIQFDLNGLAQSLTQFDASITILQAKVEKLEMNSRKEE